MGTSQGSNLSSDERSRHRRKKGKKLSSKPLDLAAEILANLPDKVGTFLVLLISPLTSRSLVRCLTLITKV